MLALSTGSHHYLSTEIRPDEVSVLHPADGERERAAAVSEADLESRESLEDAAHQQGHHCRRRFGRHAWTKRPNIRSTTTQILLFPLGKLAVWRRVIAKLRS